MRVLVTRPGAQGDGTARRLTLRGHQPLVAPLLTVELLPETGPERPSDALLVTSANAVPAALRFLPTHGGLPAFAVGASTARALVEAGFSDVRTGESDGAALARLVRDTLAPGAVLLHLAGRDRRPEPRRSLLRFGFAVTVVEAYAATAATRLPDAIATVLAAGEIDAALHFSPRSAGVLVALAEEAGLADALGRILHVCLSPKVAKALDPLGPRRLAVAARPGEEEVFAALDRAGRPERGEARAARPPDVTSAGTNPAGRACRTITDDRPPMSETGRRDPLRREPPTIDLKTSEFKRADPPGGKDGASASAGAGAVPEETDAAPTAIEPMAAAGLDPKSSAGPAKAEAAPGPAAKVAAASAGASVKSPPAPGPTSPAPEAGRPAGGQANPTSPSVPSPAKTASTGPGTPAKPAAPPATVPPASAGAGKPGPTDSAPAAPAAAAPSTAGGTSPSAGPARLEGSRPSGPTIQPGVATQAAASASKPAVPPVADKPSGGAAASSAPDTAKGVSGGSSASSAAASASARPAEPSSKAGLSSTAQPHSDAARPPSPPASGRRGALWAAGIIGGLTGAALGLAADRLWSPASGGLETRLAALESRPAPAGGASGADPALERRLAELETRSAQLARSGAGAAAPGPAAGGNIEDLVRRVTGLEEGARQASAGLSATSDLAGRLGQLEAQITQQSTAGAAASERLGASLEALRAEQTRLAEAVASVTARLGAVGSGLDAVRATTGTLDANVRAVGGTLAAVQSGLGALEGKVGEGEKRLGTVAADLAKLSPAAVQAGLRVVVAGRLDEALRTGAPLGPSLSSLEKLGADPGALAALRPFAAAAPPDSATLAREFKPLADRILAEPRPNVESFSDRLLRMADRVVTVRAVGDGSGADLPGLVARIEAALGRNNPADAAGAWEALPDAAKTVSAAWAERLKSRVAAEAAARRVGGDALSALDASTR